MREHRLSYDSPSGDGASGVVVRILCGQLRLSAKVLIGKLMQLVLPKRLGLPSLFGEPVARLIIISSEGVGSFLRLEKLMK